MMMMMMMMMMMPMMTTMMMTMMTMMMRMTMKFSDERFFGVETRLQTFNSMNKSWVGRRPRRITKPCDDGERQFCLAWQLPKWYLNQWTSAIDVLFIQFSPAKMIQNGYAIWRFPKFPKSWGSAKKSSIFDGVVYCESSILGDPP